MPLPTGVRVGPYEVLGELGAGGMGQVYRARDAKLGRDVALKILPDIFAHDPDPSAGSGSSRARSRDDRLARFRREAQMLGALNHPNIAHVYGIEDSAVGPVIVMELVEGVTLGQLIDSALDHAPSGGEARQAAGVGPRGKPRKDGLPLDDVLPIARQIADALEAAHERGIIHRDLKPANIKVRPDGTVKVLDFGLAKALERDPASAGAGGARAHDLAMSPTMTSPAMTEMGMILGTAAYMAPEQAKGRPVDKRADIWAFGCVLYEMVTGRPPFAGDDVSDTLANILKAEPDWAALPAKTPEALRRLLQRCLSKDLSGRLPDIGVARLEIAEAMTPGARHSGAAAQPTTPVKQPRSRWRDVALGVAVAALVAVSPFIVTHFRETPEAPAPVRFTVGPAGGTRYPLNPIQSSVALSPNGRTLAFRAQQPGGSTTLWVRELETMNARELAGTEGAGFLFWSPDSRSLAFASGGQLKRVDVSGGPVQTVCEIAGIAGASWGAGGTIVLGNLAGGLLQVPAAGGQPAALTSIDAARKETNHGHPHFLPDGRRFLFTAHPGNAIFLASLDSPERTLLGEADSNALYAPPGYLVFLRQGTLMAQPFDAAGAALSGNPTPIAEQVASAGRGSMGVFSVSGTGVLVYQSAGEELTGLPVWVDRQGREIGPVAGGTGEVQFPRLSPDGRRLAVTRGGDLWVEDLQGRPSIRLTFDGNQRQHFSPFWSPDGRLLVYETNEESSAPLRSLPADGSTSTSTLVSPIGHFHPHGWSRDGRGLLAVHLRPGGNDIVLIPFGEKGEPRDVVATPANEGNLGAALSPDGRWLAYAANPTGQQEIWVRPYPGPGAPVRLSPNGGVEPVWARNGRELYYIEGKKLMAVAVQPGEDFRFAAPVMLFETGYMRTGVQPPTYDVASDGRFVMLKSAAGQDPGTRPLNVVLNWIDGLTRRTQGR